MNLSASGKSAPGRPRSNQARNNILGATLTLLKTNGYNRLTMEGIAKAAGVGKPTLYRWWPNIPAVVMEAVQLQAAIVIVVPDTGSLRKDLLEFIGQTCHALNDYFGEIMRCLMAEAQLHPDFAATFRDEFIHSRREKLIEILNRGTKRKELKNDADLEFLADLCYGPIWYRLLNGHAALDEVFVRSIVDQMIK